MFAFEAKIPCQFYAYSNTQKNTIPNLVLIGPVASEEKIFEKLIPPTMMDAKWWQ